jgi:hypothetical protein
MSSSSCCRQTCARCAWSPLPRVGEESWTRPTQTACARC